MNLILSRKAATFAGFLFLSSTVITSTAFAQAASKGYIDGITGDSVTGWACTEGYAESVDVHVYIGGYAGNYGAHLASGVANLTSDPLVEAECDSGFYYHRFQVSLSGIKRFGGQSVWVHGINTHGGISVPILNSGTYTVPNPSGFPATPTGFEMDVTRDHINNLELRELSWDAVPGYTYYAVSKLRGDTAYHTEVFVAGTTLSIFVPIGSPDRYMVSTCVGASIGICGKYSAPIYAD